MRENTSGLIVIAGQGLAGTLLAWHLVRAGRRVLILDEDAPVTSSKIAAGIITPITGKRLTVRADTGAFLTEAMSCYAETARTLGKSHFHRSGQVRLWKNEDEPLRFETRKKLPEFTAHLAPERTGPLVDLTQFHGTGEGFEMATSGWLDTRRWLADSAAWFEARGMLRRMKFDPAALRPEAGGVMLPDGLLAEAVVFCEGAEGRKNPWFSWLKWKCAKGGILTVSAPALAGERRIVHHEGWLLPADEIGTFRAGSTYAWNDFDPLPSAADRDVLEARMSRLLRVPFQVTAHEAAVRPIIHESLARMGRHPVHPDLVFFNGLGSKGVLHGPRYARMLAEHLVEDMPLPPEVDVARNA